jgi:hypothetical protein
VKIFPSHLHARATADATILDILVLTHDVSLLWNESTMADRALHLSVLKDRNVWLEGGGRGKSIV